MLDFHESQHPALGEGLITVNDSMPSLKSKREGLVDPAKVQYLIVDIHGGKHDFPFPKSVEPYLPQNGDLYQKYINAERDSGVPELTQELLKKFPCGLSLSVNPPRGVLDTIWATPANAIKKVVSPDIDPEAKKDFFEMHHNILELTAKVIATLSSNVRILCLHSMEPYNTPDQPKLAHDAESIRKYIEAYANRVLSEETIRKTDLIVGQNGQPPIGDMEMAREIEKLFQAKGYPIGYNDPYDTEPGFTDYDDMQKYPGRVHVVDILKPLLCEGSGDDRSFDTTNPRVDNNKVQIMAALYTEALSKILRAK